MRSASMLSHAFMRHNSNRVYPSSIYQTRPRSCCLQSFQRQSLSAPAIGSTGNKMLDMAIKLAEEPEAAGPSSKSSRGSSRE